MNATRSLTLLIGIFVGVLLISTPSTSIQSSKHDIEVVAPEVTQIAVANPTMDTSITPLTSQLAAPIAEFRERITKKSFGSYVTPENSPVQPERFSGFHTGIDVEYTDILSDVPVYAVSDGIIVRSGIISGYGGLTVLRFSLNEQPYHAVYGHLRPASLPKVGEEVKKGTVIGLLGTGLSPETDGERRHLHFALYHLEPLSILGYVQRESHLNEWIDPLTLLP